MRSSLRAPASSADGRGAPARPARPARAAQRLPCRGGVPPPQDAHHVGRPSARSVAQRARDRRGARHQPDSGPRGDPEARAGRAGDALPEPGRDRHEALHDRRPRDLAAPGDPGARGLRARRGPDRPGRACEARGRVPRAPGAGDGPGGVRGVPAGRRGLARAHRRLHRERDAPERARDAQRAHRPGPRRHVAGALPERGRRAPRDHRRAQGARRAGGDGRDAPPSRSARARAWCCWHDVRLGVAGAPLRRGSPGPLLPGVSRQPRGRARSALRAARVRLVLDRRSAVDARRVGQPHRHRHADLAHSAGDARHRSVRPPSRAHRGGHRVARRALRRARHPRPRGRRLGLPRDGDRAEEARGGAPRGDRADPPAPGRGGRPSTRASSSGSAAARWSSRPAATSRW